MFPHCLYSLDFEVLSDKLERTCDCKLTDNECKNIRTVGDVIRFLGSHVSSAPSKPISIDAINRKPL